MADIFTDKKRSTIMSKVHSKNTAPEIYVRKLLFSMGYRFRLHRKDLPGNPDSVLAKYSTAIFVNGCFWHGCPICRHAQIRPSTNSDYWNRKLDRTLQRDKENLSKLKEMGWTPLVIWECETKKKNRPAWIEKITDHFSYIK